MSAYEGVSFLTALLSKDLDVVVPCHHGLVRLGSEYPSMAAVHGSSLATFDNELMGRTSRLGPRAKLLVGQV
jgi:hypothetical protein